MQHPTRFLLGIIALLFLLHSCQPDKAVSPSIYGPFLGMQPTESPQLLAPDLLASSLVEFNGTFTSDGKLFFYTSDIPNQGLITFTEMKEDGSWSTPFIAPFSGAYSEYDPIFSPDGSRLYFSSRRPTDIYQNRSKSNIWWVEKDGISWSEPELVPLAEEDIYYNSVTDAGAIYFNIWSSGKIFKASPLDTGFQIDTLPEHLQAGGKIVDPFIAPNEDYMLFRGYGDDSYGRGDLYISFQVNGQWTARQNLGLPINSEEQESCPAITPDGQFLVFSSSRQQKAFEPKPLQILKELQQQNNSYDNGELNIYYISTTFIEKLRTKAVLND